VKSGDLGCEPVFRRMAIVYITKGPCMSFM